MATIVNNPPATNNSGGFMGMAIALIVLLALAYFGFIYGLPALKQMQLGAPQINIPSKIDVNVNQVE